VADSSGRRKYVGKKHLSGFLTVYFYLSKIFAILIIYLSRDFVCLCVIVCVCVSQFVSERSAILLVLAIKLTVRRPDGGFGEEEIEMERYGK
jgi:hypothetical protein